MLANGIGMDDVFHRTIRQWLESDFCTVASAGGGSHCAANSCSPTTLKNQERKKENRNNVFIDKLC